MNTSMDQQTCVSRCWKLAILAGVLVAVLLIALGGWLWWRALVIGFVVFAVAIVALQRLLCVALPDEDVPMPASGVTPKNTPELPMDSSGKMSILSGNTRKPSLVSKAEMTMRSGSVSKSKVMVEAEAVVETAPVAEPDPLVEPGNTGKTAKPIADMSPDDLKRISGVGPVIEKKLLGAKVTTFAQIAGWTAQDVNQIEELLSFKGRISRGNWIEQAGILAAGGESEFSKHKT